MSNDWNRDPGRNIGLREYETDGLRGGTFQGQVCGRTYPVIQKAPEPKDDEDGTKGARCR